MMMIMNLIIVSSLVAPSGAFVYATRTVSSRNVNIDKDGKVWVIKINRLDKKNAVDAATAAELAEAFRSFEVDSEALVAVLGGEGGTFSSGLDENELSKSPEEFVKSLSPPGEGDAPMGPTRLKLTKPVVGAIQGQAVAAGLELALMCDLRVVEEDAVMGFGFNRKSGVPLLDGGNVRLPYIVGLSRALDLILTEREVFAEEVKLIGLANRVVPSGEGITKAIELAKVIASFPQDALKADRKSAFYAAYNAESFYDALYYEYRKAAKIDIVRHFRST